MALKHYNPTSPSRRGLILVDRSALHKGGPVKALTEGKRKTGGRNNKGHVTSRGIAGGHKQRYRIVDFKRRKWDVEGTVERLEYDPNRTAFLALINYGPVPFGEVGENGEKSDVAYIIAPQRLAVGDKVVAGKKTDVKPGNAMEIGQMPVGTIVHNVEMKPGKGGQIARSAGTYVQVVGRDRGMVIVRLNSGEQRYIRGECMATVGAVSNPDNQNTNLAKAGRNRWKGIRPLTRGVAKNPVDHPHGGGEGRTSGGRHPVTPWGKPTKGARTRHNKSTDRMIIRSRHAKKKG
ncbi:50S ribosomal protein L2 [Sphingomonas sp. S1-29]|uniref:50S ribosomal protein L2 n=1 Tax=Sphingomonas sp. S1-29 TaxID=2991074 RepID=UPI00223F60F2|nr:50S ribosomal protein L2 [Sphingomonas sp. S1-29]UZK69400.1 50S ribosomal protein L2 [Sphingomonas sp. S1-29]